MITSVIGIDGGSDDAGLCLWELVWATARHEKTKTRDESGRCPHDGAGDNRKFQLSFGSFAGNQNKSFHHTQCALAEPSSVFASSVGGVAKMPGCEI